MFEGTEFGGGTLARYSDDGALLFVLALILTFKFPRAAAASALVAVGFSCRNTSTLYSRDPSSRYGRVNGK